MMQRRPAANPNASPVRKKLPWQHGQPPSAAGVGRYTDPASTGRSHADDGGWQGPSSRGGQRSPRGRPDLADPRTYGSVAPSTAATTPHAPPAAATTVAGGLSTSSEARPTSAAPRARGPGGPGGPGSSAPVSRNRSPAPSHPTPANRGPVEQPRPYRPRAYGDYGGDYDLLIEPVNSLSPGGATDSTFASPPAPSNQRTAPAYASASPARSTYAEAGSPGRRYDDHQQQQPPNQHPHDHASPDDGMARYDDHAVHERANQQRRRLWAAQGGGAPMEDPDPLVRHQHQHQHQHQAAPQPAAYQPQPQPYPAVGGGSGLASASPRDEDLAVSKATSMAGSSTTPALAGTRGHPGATAASAPPSDSSTAQPTPQSRPTPPDPSLPMPGMHGGHPPHHHDEQPPPPQSSPPREKLEKLAAQTRMLHEAVQRYRSLLADETQRREAAEARVAELEARVAASEVAGGGGGGAATGRSRGASASPPAAEPPQGHDASPLGPGEREELLGRVDVLERQNEMLRGRLLSSTLGGSGTPQHRGQVGGGHYGGSTSRLPSRSPAAAAALANASRGSLPPASDGGLQLLDTAGTGPCSRR